MNLCMINMKQFFWKLYQNLHLLQAIFAFLKLKVNCPETHYSGFPVEQVIPGYALFGWSREVM